MGAQPPPKFAHRTIQAPDGASLSYYTIGQGPGLIILHGSISYALRQSELAALLSSSYTVYLPSTRDHGLSGPFPESVTSMPALLPSNPTSPNKPSTPNLEIRMGGISLPRTYDPAFSKAVVETLLSDINILIAETNPMYLLSLSSGAMITLQAFISPASVPAFSSIKKIIIFEPPLVFPDIDTGINVKGMRRYEEEIAAGDFTGALTTVMKIAQLGPYWIPRVVIEAMTWLMFWFEARKGSKSKGSSAPLGKAEGIISEMDDHGKVTMMDMAPTLRYDLAILEHMIGDVQRFENIASGREILFLDGAKSPDYMKKAVERLGNIVKGARRAEIPDVGHAVLCNAEMRGNPSKAVPYIKDFFT